MSGWLVSRRFDLTMFLLPALVALALVPLGPADGETPVGMWIVAVLFVDIAHVWSTIYRTYLDRAELARRPVLYAAAPVVAYGVGVALMSISFAAFWTGLAYVAVFHFVRQQYGWVALYNRKDPQLTKLDRIVDSTAIYASTMFPLLWWHAHLPRGFAWFLEGDFIVNVVPPVLVDMLWPVYVVSLVAFAVRQIHRYRWEGSWRTGKIIVVATTAACWGIGIIVTNTDWAFTVTNVLIHGVPYFGLVWLRGRAKPHRPGSFLGWVFRTPAGLVPFYVLVVLLASAEEFGWDRLVWHPTVEMSEMALLVVVPLLALPQFVHYILDGFIWRTAHGG